MENVEARLAALELAVTELREELARERSRIRTMRQTHQCPSCGSKRIVYFLRINESANTMDGVLPLGLDTHRSWRGTEGRNPLHLYACRGCGLVEWHAPYLEYIKADGKTVFEVETDAPAPGPPDPYR